MEYSIVPIVWMRKLRLREAKELGEARCLESTELGCRVFSGVSLFGHFSSTLQSNVLNIRDNDVGEVNIFTLPPLCKILS